MNRRGGREFALHLLYQLDVRGESIPEVLPSLLEMLQPTGPDRGFAITLVEKVLAHRPAIDEILAGSARNWDPARFALLDRCALQLAVAELLFHPETPTGVILNEAIELAKSYSTDQSARFVNGVLDPIAKAVRERGEVPESLRDAARLPPSNPGDPS